MNTAHHGGSDAVALAAELAGTRRAQPPAVAGRRHASRLFEGPRAMVLTAALDVLMTGVAVVGALAWAAAAQTPTHGAVALAAFPAVLAATHYARGGYRQRLRFHFIEQTGMFLTALSVAAMLVLTLLVLTGAAERPGALVTRVWLLSALVGTAVRGFVAVGQRAGRRHWRAGTPTLIIGTGAVGAHVARRLDDHPEYGLRLVGFLDADPPNGGLGVPSPILGEPEQVARVAERTGARHVILAFSSLSDSRLVPVVRTCHRLGIEVSVVPRMFDAVNERMALEHLGGLPLTGLRAVDPRGWQFRVKHALDRVVAGGALVLLSPLMLAVACAVRVSSPGPVLFRQRRVGRDGQSFDLLKFRSMRMSAVAGEEEFDLPNGIAPGGVEGEDRRTRFGTWLRNSSLDELPQLINVVRGEMSLIGPRPERPEFVERFEADVERYGERHRVKAGITGWAQVHGLRGQTSIADRAEWDNHYIENWSLRLDLRILLLTLAVLIKRGYEA